VEGVTEQGELKPEVYAQLGDIKITYTDRDNANIDDVTAGPLLENIDNRLTALRKLMDCINSG
jgi:hypothetical protein